MPLKQTTATLVLFILLPCGLLEEVFGLQTPPKYAAIPGLLNSLGREGSYAASGYNPLKGLPCDRIFPITYPESERREWYDTNTNRLHSIPHGFNIYDTPLSAFELQKVVIMNESQFYDYTVETEYSALITLVLNAASIDFAVFAKAGLKQSGRTYVVLSHQVELFTVTTWPSSMLGEEFVGNGQYSNSSFAREVNMLPNTRDSYEEKMQYTRFLDKLGTDYASNMQFGATLDIVVSFNESVALKVGGEAKARAEAELLLYYVAALMGMADVAAELNISVAMRAGASIAIVAYGGDPTTIESKDLTQWLASIPNNPASINTTFTPTYELIKDSTKAKLVQAAREEYLSKDNISNAAKMKGACGAPPEWNLTVSDLPSPAALNEWRGTVPTATGSFVPHTVVSALPSAFVGHVGKSFDIKSGTFRRQLAVVNSTTSYNNAQEFFYPYSNKTFAVPDVLSVANTPAAGIRFDGVIYGNISSVIDTWLHGAFDVATIACVGDAHVLAEIVAGVESNTTGFASVAFDLILTFKLSRSWLHSDGVLRSNPQFLRDLRSLKDTDIIKKYGSHYVKSNAAGGSFGLRFVLDGGFIAKYGVDATFLFSVWKLSQMLEVLGFDLLIDEFHNISTYHPPIDWQIYKFNISFVCNGGDCSVLGTPQDPVKNSAKAWLNSVGANPAALWSPRFNSIRFGLLSDFFESAERRIKFDQSLKDYLQDSSIGYNGEHEPKAMLSKRPNRAESSRLNPKDAGTSMTVKQAIPGVGIGDGPIGVGTGINSLNTGSHQLLRPKRQVVKMTRCPSECNVQPPNPKPECAGCILQAVPYVNKFYRVPREIQIETLPSSTGSASSAIFQHVEDWTSSESESQGINIGIYKNTKVVHQFYEKYFKESMSMVFEDKLDAYYKASLWPANIQPSLELRTAILLLPKQYDKAKYRALIEMFGDSWIDKAWVGGGRIQNTYFHSCFLYVASGKDIKTATDWTFVVYNHGDSKHHAKGINTSEWESSISNYLGLLGGKPFAYGHLARNGGKMDPASIEEFEKSIKEGHMIPVKYSLKVLTDLLVTAKPPIDPQKIENINRTIYELAGEVKDMNEDAVKNLIPKDNYCVPSWCKCKLCNPKPPNAAPAPWYPKKKIGPFPECKKS